MKRAVIVALALASWMLAAGRSACADDFSPTKLNPLAKRAPGSSVHGPTTKPSAWYKLRADMRKLGDGTKRFLTGVADTLTLKPLRTKPQPPPWGRWQRGQPEPRPKSSWLDSLFRRQEPKPIQSMKDFVGLPRPDL